MPVLSNGDLVQWMELYIEQETSEIDLGPLMYDAGAYPDSVELYINGLLQCMVGQYSAEARIIVLIDAVQPGDTVKVVAIENIE